MAPFTPIGDRPRWAVVYDFLKAHDVAEVVTYAELAEVLDLDPVRNRSAVQVAVRSAAGRFLTEERQALEAVPNVGYRIVEASEHLRLAKGHQAKASTALVRSHKTVVHTDVNGFDPALRRVFEVTATALSYQMDFIRRLDVRTAELESTMNVIAAGRERTDEEVAEIRRRLDRMESLKVPGASAGND